MIRKQKVIVVMPAYNAEKTIRATYEAIPKNIVDEIIVVDDNSHDNTILVAQKLGLTVVQHTKNLGYGANQKTCYQEALKRKADIVIMIHPDYQYDSSLTEELIRPILQNRFDIMFGSRIRTRYEAINGGMPQIKYVINRIVSLTENIILGVNFTEHFSGFRAYSKKVLTTVPYMNYSNGFVFDQQIMTASIYYGFKIAEYPVPVRYFLQSSSIGYRQGIVFLIGTFYVLLLFIAAKLQIYKSKMFP